MIFEDQCNAARTSNLLLGLCLEFPSSEWEVFEPEYLGFASEAEYDARAIKIAKHQWAFLLSSGELQRFIAENAIGFDWTDLRMLHDGREILYLQNVDSAKWYGKTDDVNVMRFLDACGLSNSGLADLPFPPWSRLSCKG